MSLCSMMLVDVRRCLQMFSVVELSGQLISSWSSIYNLSSVDRRGK